jgi:hypothetical protein
MKELQALKKIIEKQFNIEDISENTRVGEYPLARAVYIVAACRFFYDTDTAYKVLSLNQIGKLIKRDHSTLVYWRAKWTFWATKEHKNILLKVESAFSKSLESNIEVHILKLNKVQLELRSVKDKLTAVKSELNTHKTVEERWLENFTQEQLDNFRPRMEAYMKMNNIEFA